jgi:hypothetical protein
VVGAAHVGTAALGCPVAKLDSATELDSHPLQHPKIWHQGRFQARAKAEVLDLKKDLLEVLAKNA